MHTEAEQAAYRSSRPAKRMGAGAVCRDAQSRVLLVQPSYKQGWEVPGGAVEFDESPRAACSREVTEELGLTPTLGRMLVMEWQGPEPGRTESLMFLYDGGVVEEQGIRLATEELLGYKFVVAGELDAYLSERLARRMRAALAALDEGRLVEMEHGSLVSAS